MATRKQKQGEHGEVLVTRYCSCPRCKRDKTLKRLPPNFKCADIICDFCGFLAQAKTKRVKDIHKIPNEILGAAWGPQKERMDAGIYFSLYLILLDKQDKKRFAIHYLPAELQERDMFVPRRPLSQSAKRSGWQGFYYKLTDSGKRRMVKIVDNF